ncbi:MAG: SDR family NAD(P)-dependent oxidoreductase [Myxococcales bacterium]|nr:SDR family NAD(P)-dependent oxidoreductase [Myxococcales bacterium]
MGESAGELAGRTALITGAGSGIGREASLLMSGAGAVVVVCDIDTNGGEETVAQISAAGGEAVFHLSGQACGADPGRGREDIGAAQERGQAGTCSGPGRGRPDHRRGPIEPRGADPLACRHDEGGVSRVSKRRAGRPGQGRRDRGRGRAAG